MAERYSFTVRCDQTNMLLASGSGYATAPEAEREGRYYAFHYEIGGEPCTLRIRRDRPRKRRRVADGPKGQDVAEDYSNGTNNNTSLSKQSQ